MSSPRLLYETQGHESPALRYWRGDQEVEGGPLALG